MTKVARIEAKDAAGARVAGPRVRLGAAQREPRSQYYAFLSYSHKDEELAEWLHRELEEFHVPAALAGKLTHNGVIPRKLAPIFRDKQELAAATDLGEEIRAALAASQFLVVLCSPAAASSRWTNAEIEAFKRSRPDGCVLAVIASGDPFASDDPGREAEECFPPALRERYDKRGRATGKRAEPIAADLRGDADDRRMGFLKLVAGMLGVGLDDLVRRETTRRQRRLAWVTGGSLAGMVFASGLAITAIQARDAARDQRREAEGLVAFMLGDLKDKLEPIGKLDALDGVGSRVLSYYGKQDKAELSDAALQQRSQALSLMAQVANLRGNADGAMRLYQEAMTGTAEAVRREPNEPQRLFDHAQNVFYFGEIAALRDNLATGEAAMRTYRQLALRMIALDPDNVRWRLELQYANANLGIMLYRQRRFPASEAPLQQAFQTIQGLAAAYPENTEYQQNLPEALAWLADAKMSEGKLAEAVGLRNRQISLLEQLLTRTGDDPFYRLRLSTANTDLADLYTMAGRNDEAIVHLRTALEDAERLIAVEPNNTRSLNVAFKARSALARNLLASGKTSEAASHVTAAWGLASQLVGLNRQNPMWLSSLRGCWTLRARLALAAGAKAEAVDHARRALNVAKSITSSDPIEDRFAIAQDYLLIGDVERSTGDTAAAQQAWQAAFAALPENVAERPPEIDTRATILQRLGRMAESRELHGKLMAMGYRANILNR